MEEDERGVVRRDPGVLADGGRDAEGQPQGGQCKYSGWLLESARPALSALRDFYTQPDNARRFLAWCGEQGHDVARAAPPWVAEAAL